MVVADDKVDTVSVGEVYLVVRLYTAVEGYYQRKTVVFGKLYTFERDTVTFGISVGYVVTNVFGVLFQKSVDERYGCSAVYIVISVYEYLLLFSLICFHTRQTATKSG